MNLETVLEMLRSGTGLRTHSGAVAPGDVFVAIAGTRVNGARYIDDAVARGAQVVVHGPGVDVSRIDGVLSLEVESPARTLGVLARAACGTESRVPSIVGITGTNGKTTTAHLLHFLLSESGMPTGLIGTVHCSWPGVDEPATMTTPDCLSLHGIVGRMARDGVQTVVMEVSSHALDQERTAGLPINVGVFTNLTQDHLDYHGDMQRYFEAKARLFLDGPARCAKGLVNVDDEHGRRLKMLRPDLLAFGLDSEDAELRGEIVDAGTWGMHLGICHGRRQWQLRTALVGRHNAYNLLSAVGAGMLLGLTPEQCDRLTSATGAPGRLERVPNTHDLHIFIDYAHTPDALEKVSIALKSMGFGRLITVFGCGGDRDATKRPLMGQAVARHADVVVVTSDNPRTEDPESILDQIEPGLAGARQVLREVDRRKAIALAVKSMQPGDALLVAGKGHEDYQIIGTEKRHFSDFEVVQECLA
ncbi:MAG: UDP-N-acetylmuramoyl-L-alanyl-D-glutamate--2,6-diaminopimelate ligase [Desulfomicrobium sp.]|nr:UDP-N-acetylmuramoyl-L-alanyl-D-glutamate--2,6-diaminopimelate ligase [Desulfomicrobium sp.]